MSAALSMVRTKRVPTGRAAPDSVRPGSATSLPVPLTPLVGRTREVARAVALLRQDEVRLVTLTGPGGVGKTRLALAIAVTVADDFADGVAFVALASLADPTLVLPAIARALGIAEAGQHRLMTRVVDTLQEATTLLLLDNFEQVVEAAPLVAELLGHSPTLKVMATSRGVLRLSGERGIVVSPLSLPDPNHRSADAIEASPAVRLFVDRARANRSDFAVTEHNAQTIVAICRRLDGLPLALELAAAWIRILPPAALLTRLEHRLPMLTGGPRDLPSRQQTVRDTVAWSHDLLNPVEQTLFRRLAVFVGGFTLDAAEAVAAAAIAEAPNQANMTNSDAPSGRSAASTPSPLNSVFPLDLVSGLVELSLLAASPELDDAVAGPRFTMLETVREFGLERLDGAGELERVRRRHATWFTELAERAWEAVDTPAEQTWLNRLEREHDNLRAALDWAIGRGDAGLSLRLAAAIRSFWFVRGHLSEGRRWLERALALPGDPPFGIWAEAISGAGTLAYHQGDYPAATRLGECLLAAARPRADASSILRGEFLLGLVAYDQGELARAEASLQRGLTVARQLGDAKWIALVLSVLGPVVRERGDLERATALLEEADALWRARGSAWGLGVTALGLATVAAARGDQLQAATHCRTSLALRWQVSDTVGIVQSLVSAASIILAQGGMAPAVHLFGATAAVRDATGASLSFGLRKRFEHDLKTARATLGETEFAATWDAGRALTLEQAVSQALALLDGAPTPASAPNRAASATLPGLTPREVEILRLVAEGHSDREIGDLLSISHRTVMTHVSNILAKLNLESRTAAAAFARRRGLI